MPNIFSRLSLVFSFQAMESDYQIQIHSIRTKIFHFFMILQLIFLVLILIRIIILDPSNIDHICIFSSSAIFLFIFIIIHNKFERLFQLSLKIFLISFGLVLTEYAKVLQDNDMDMDSSGTLIFIILIQSFCSWLVIAKLKWVFASFFYFFNLVYFIIRIIPMHYNYKNPVIWLGLVTAVVNFSFMAYKQEKLYRELFKKNYESHENLNHFHLLLRNIMPSSIFILNYDKKKPEIEFLNYSALKLANKVLDESFLKKNDISQDKSFLENKKNFSYQTLKDFFKKFIILEQSFENYENDLPQIIFDFFSCKNNDFSHSLTQNEEINFLTLNLVRPAIDKTDRNIKSSLSFSSQNIFKKDEKLIQKLDFQKSSEQEKNLLFYPKFNQNNDLSNQSTILRVGLSPKNNKNLISSDNNYDSSPKHNKHYELKIAKINWNNKNCILILLSDITKTKKLIELINLDNYKNQLLASISHDLRTPLNGVIGMIQATLSEISLQVGPREYLSIALCSANLLDYLIKDILDFSQITYKKLRLNIGQFFVLDLVKEVLSMMGFQAKSRPIALELEFEIPEDRVCVSDANRIKQILINLIGNAIKFTKQGFVKLKVESNYSIVLGYPRLKFSVEDTGIGIRNEDQIKLFTLFGKIDQEDAEINKNGIGLGLVISNNLAKLLDEKSLDQGIHCESLYGKGSLFCFYVDPGPNTEFQPKIRQESSEMITAERNIFKKPRDFENICKRKISDQRLNITKEFQNKISIENEFSNDKKTSHINIIDKNISSRDLFSHGKDLSNDKKSLKINLSNLDLSFGKETIIDKKPLILLVDDDLINLFVLEKYLEAFPVKTRRARNGAEAVNFIEQFALKENKRIDLILMDCNMPILNGYEATKLILNALKENKREMIPIFGVTANDTDIEVEKCKKSGMKKVLCKPVRKEDFVSMIEELLFNK